MALTGNLAHRGLREPLEVFNCTFSLSKNILWSEKKRMQIWAQFEIRQGAIIQTFPDRIPFCILFSELTKIDTPKISTS